LWYVAVCCGVLQCVVMCCSVLWCVWSSFHNLLHLCIMCWGSTVSNLNALQHTATHCNTLQHTATHCNTLQRTCPEVAQYLSHLTISTEIAAPPRSTESRISVWCVAVWCSVLQCVAVCCSVLQWISDSSVSCGTHLNRDLGFIWICTKKFGFSIWCISGR